MIEEHRRLKSSYTDTMRGKSGREVLIGSPVRFDLTEIEVRWDEDDRTLWSFMTPTGQPKYTEALLRDMDRWQQQIQSQYADGLFGMRYLVLGCRHPGAFNLGGDLQYVAGAIARRDIEALEAYGNRCVDVLYRNLTSLDLPIVTIALLQGDAIGGGLESSLSFNVIVAERHVRFSLPENAFGMFPGAGAHSLLTRRLNAAQAERMMLSGRAYSAQEMYDAGLVHILVDTGEGEAAVQHYIRQNRRRFSGHLGVYRAMREVDPVSLLELRRIVRIWAETGMRLDASQIKMLEKLSEKQQSRPIPVTPSELIATPRSAVSG